MDSGQIIELRIEDMLDDGRAFGRCEGLAVFVSGGCAAEDGEVFAGAVPGDLVRAEIMKEKKNSAEAKLLEKYWSPRLTDVRPSARTSESAGAALCRR